MGRAAFCIVALFALTASRCPFHDSDGPDEPAPAVTEPTPNPPVEPPPKETCWDESVEIDAEVGCHSVSFDVAGGELETYTAFMTYPQDFQFNGFLVVGESGTPVGAMQLGLTLFDSPAVDTVSFVSLTDTSAYADVFNDGRFSPDLEPVFEQVHGNEFRLRLPLGGDADPETLIVPLDVSVTLRLREELMTASPTASLPMPARFTVSGERTTVDPETGGADDGAGAPPIVLPFMAEVTVIE